MDQNKRGKYLKYAIGEIILVVIGILIALQINNWNTQRLQGIKEVNYIHEIKSNLEEDLAQIETVIDFNTLKANTIDSLFTLFGRESDPIKYMPAVTQYMSVLTSYQMFTPVRIAFENMVSSENIDLVSQKELRKHLSLYYSTGFDDGTQERVKQVTRKFGDDIGPPLWNKQMFKIITNYNSHLQDVSKLNIHENGLIYSNLLTMKFNIVAQNQLINDSKESVENLILMIDNFIKED